MKNRIFITVLLLASIMAPMFAMQPTLVGREVLEMPSGKKLLVGYTLENNHKILTFQRVNQDGSVDTTFREQGPAGSNAPAGTIRVHFADAEETYPTAARVLPDGKILVDAMFDSAPVQIRFNQDLTVDTVSGQEKLQ